MGADTKSMDTHACSAERDTHTKERTIGFNEHVPGTFFLLPRQGLQVGRHATHTTALWHNDIHTYTTTQLSACGAGGMAREAAPQQPQTTAGASHLCLSPRVQAHRPSHHAPPHPQAYLTGTHANPQQLATIRAGCACTAVVSLLGQATLTYLLTCCTVHNFLLTPNTCWTSLAACAAKEATRGAHTQLQPLPSAASICPYLQHDTPCCPPAI